MTKLCRIKRDHPALRRPGLPQIFHRPWSKRKGQNARSWVHPQMRTTTGFAQSRTETECTDYYLHGLNFVFHSQFVVPRWTLNLLDEATAIRRDTKALTFSHCRPHFLDLQTAVSASSNILQTVAVAGCIPKGYSDDVHNIMQGRIQIRVLRVRTPTFFTGVIVSCLIRVSDVAFSFRLVKSRLLMQDFFEIKAFLCHKSVKNNNFCHHMGSFKLRMHQNPFAAPEPTAWGSLLNKRWFHHCLGP